MARHVDVRYINYYTNGSAAQKVAKAEPLKMLKLPKVRKHSRRRIVLHIDPIATAGIILSAVMLICMAVGVAQLKAAQQNTATMQAYVETLRQENRELSYSYEGGYDLAEVEKTALALGLVPQDQVKRISLQVPNAQQVEEPGAWERICTFLTGLFA